MPGLHTCKIFAAADGVDEYTTIAAWEADVDGELDMLEKGECAAEVFDENVTITSSTTTSDYYMWLTSESGAEHDGRADEVSSAGNARIEGDTNLGVIYIYDEYTRVDWLEQYIDTDAAGVAVTVGSVSACTIYVHHMLAHNNHKSSHAGNWGIYCGDVDAVMYVYRNISYGHGSEGIYGYHVPTCDAHK